MRDGSCFEPVNNLPDQLVPKPSPLTLDGDARTLLIIVAIVAGLFIIYLAVDFIRGRWQSRDLQSKKDKARERWEKEQGS